MSRLYAPLPAMLALAFATSLGGFESATRFPQAAIAAALVVLASITAWREMGDPLRLGRSGRWLPWLAVAWAAASWALSPVPRAGRTAVALLPAFLLLPAACARTVDDAACRRLAAAAWAVAVAAVSSWALAAAAAAGWSRAAAPLGHHTLLGAWLAITLPLAAAGLAERGWVRALAAVALVSGGAALVASRSLAALGALVVAALVAARLPGGARKLAAGLALLGLALVVPRLDAIARGRDSSASARLVYAQGAIAGADARPLFGWGPGSLPWTLPRFERPRPGVNPAGELVGEPHTTPLRVAYETGWAGLLLILAVVARLARRLEEGASGAPALVRGGRLGALAGAIAALGGSWLAVPALPVALAAALGCGLGGLASARPSRATRRAALGFGALYLVVAGLALGRPLAAQAAYAAALHAPGVERRLEELDRAVRLDPQFPLYRARRAWIGPEDARTRAYQALVAARDSLGVAPLWLRAGSMALAAGEQAAAHQAFERAMAFDPLGADAPFLLFITSAGGEVDCAARSMLADPRLAAAAFWRGREAVRRRAIDVVSRWDGVDAGWREAFVRQATRLSFVSHDEVDLVSRIDEEPALSASLHLFRRPGAPQELTRIRLVRPALDAVGLPSAAALATSKPAAFPPETCAPR